MDNQKLPTRATGNRERLQAHAGLDVSLEGISGCGKSFLLNKLREALQDTFVTVLEEIDDRQEEGYDQEILTLLRKRGDRFFRSGYARMDTLLLMALLAYDAEHTVEPALAAGQIVLEDRSIDTVAIYQALILHPLLDDEHVLAEANHLYQWACQWRHPPDITFLLVDDFTASARRAQQRAAGMYSPKELAFLRRAATLYDRYACCYPDRIIRLDRRHLDVDEMVETMRATILCKYQGGNA
jgi:dTMP kinase